MEATEISMVSAPVVDCCFLMLERFFSTCGFIMPGFLEPKKNSRFYLGVVTFAIVVGIFA